MRITHVIYVVLFSTLLQIYNAITSFLIWSMEKLNRRRIIKDRESNEDYLERYYLFLRDRKDFPFNIFLHKFLKSDPDELHDHPWDFITIILRGGYWEHTTKGKFWKKPFSIHYRKATDLHRIELDKKVNDVWTLFIPLRRKREWGFKTDKGWVHNEKYLQDKIKEK